MRLDLNLKKQNLHEFEHNFLSKRMKICVEDDGKEASCKTSKQDDEIDGELKLR